VSPSESPPAPGDGDGDGDGEADGDRSAADAFRVEPAPDAADGGRELRTDGSGRAQADGGTTDTSDRAAAFRSDSDYSMSRGDELRELYDRKFYAPMQIMLSDYRGILGGTIMLFFLLMGTVGVAIVPRPSQTPQVLLPAFQDLSYPLGTDGAGRGLVRMIVHSTPRMLQLMLGGAVFSALLSVGVGTVSGFKRGMTDRVLMTITDTALTLPGIPLLIVIVAILQPSNPFLIGVILSINAWAGGARSLRSQVLQIRSEDHVEAGRAMGISSARNI
jgi:peptide/nickel transport system permease protein